MIESHQPGVSHASEQLPISDNSGLPRFAKLQTIPIGSIRERAVLHDGSCSSR
jgi:hypothetical protein